MESGNTSLQSVAYTSLHKLFKSLPTHYIFCILLLFVSRSIWKYIHSKVYQKKCSKTIPALPWLTYLRLITVNRKCANVWFLRLIFGACRLYPKEGMYAIKIGPVNYVFLYHHDPVEFLLGSRTILHKGPEYDFFKKIFRDGLFMTNSSKWHTRRRQITPSMHFKILDDYFPSFSQQANILVGRINEGMKNATSIGILHIVGLCSIDSLLETMMGIRVKEIESHRMKFFDSIRRADVILSERVSLPWYWSNFIFNRTEGAKTLRNYKDIFKEFVAELIEIRKRDVMRKQDAKDSKEVHDSIYGTGGESKHRLPTLDLLLNLHFEGKSVLSHEELIDEILNLLTAGHDTTNLSVSWTLYLLGLHPEIQRNVHQELDDVLGDDINRIVTSEDIRSLNYLHTVFKESMRLYPPAGIITRILDEDTEINGYQVEKGTTLAIPVYMLHRNPEVFPDPEKFIPDRFSKENCKNIHPFAYIPFSAGPRNCIGQRFAIYNALSMLSTVLRHFNVEAIEPRDKTEVTFNLLLVPENDLHLKFTNRQYLKEYSI